MDSLDFWRLCDALSVIQAALLIAGEDPSGTDEYVMGWEPHQRPEGFNASFSALKNAVNSGGLDARVIFSGEFIEYFYEGESGADWVRSSVPDWNLTVIKVDDLKKWLLNRGIKPTFFFPQDNEERAYLDPSNQFYAPKLAAAVKAWEAVTADQKLLSKKTPKQALEKWLREHATEYGLTKEDGTHNGQGIDQIAKVANWKPEGGASKTPVAAIANPPPPLKALANNDLSPDDDLAGQISF